MFPTRTIPGGSYHDKSQNTANKIMHDQAMITKISPIPQKELLSILHSYKKKSPRPYNVN